MELINDFYIIDNNIGPQLWIKAFNKQNTCSGTGSPGELLEMPVFEPGSVKEESTPIYRLVECQMTLSSVL